MSEATSKEKETEKSGNKQSKGENAEAGASDSTSGMSVNALRRYLEEKLGFYDDDDVEKPSVEKVKVLDEVSLDGIVKYIKEKQCKNIITMAGAGISTSAGIPDFRSPGTGLYHNLQKYKLPHPQAIFELDFFVENPKPFFVLAKELYPGCFKPTVCHYFIKSLIDKGLLLRHYTQNIDTLERVAGITDDKIVEAHGTFHTGHCLGCRKLYNQEWMKERIFKDEIPTCEICPGIVKPDIVFFGENLPEKFHNLTNKDFAKCDLLIILGSSLVVQPFASLVDRVKDGVPRLLINREKAGEQSKLMALMGMGGGLQFDAEDNARDVAWLGDCDEGCLELADKMGWGDELRELCKKEHERIEKETDKEDKSESDEKEEADSEIKKED
ncbi:unnamed protein product [Brassicogethes aeneus]|uniref:NAD-dependent protein deacetylase n=1 Tax=Brassicogethes aeneus TaxID=1431903 RepID=A0A9P0FG77_BRAAE|nr:unnamed protein product [Brassicogethes aeneus]